MKIAVIQYDIAWADRQANFNTLRPLINEAAHNGARLIVLPEMFTTGFSMEARSLAETMAGATVGWLREEAAALGCAITGSLIVEDGGQHYNRLVWATPQKSSSPQLMKSQSISIETGLIGI